MHGAKRAAAERGELRFALPVGSVRDAEGATIIDPDQEVTAAVADVFAAFQATGSAYGVVGASPADDSHVEPMVACGLVNCAGVG